MEGELYLSDHGSFRDLIDFTCLFGYDGPIFKKRFSTAEIKKGSIVGIIS